MKTLTALIASTLISQGAITAQWGYEDTFFSVSVVDGGEQVGEVFYFGVDVTIKARGGDAILLQSAFGFHDEGQEALSITRQGEFDTPQYSTDGYETIVDFHNKFKVDSKAFTAGDELSLFYRGQTERDVDINSFLLRVVDSDGFGINEADTKVFYNSLKEDLINIVHFQQAPSPVEVEFNTLPIPEPQTALLSIVAAALTLRRKR